MKKFFLKDCKAKNLSIQENLELSPLTSFRSGGKAEMFCQPESETDLQNLLILSKEHSIHITVLGAGSNVLAPDTILPGLTICTRGLQKIEILENSIAISAGLSVIKVASTLANLNLRCMDFLYGMPGTVGGAVWMNARAYGKEISDILLSTSGFSLEGIPWHYNFNAEDFAYKKSPFSKMGIITQCTFKKIVATSENAANISEQESISLIWQDLLSHQIDRWQKGHYIAPCAGSVFKNNYTFGAPSGQILDQLGWRTKHLNEARVNPYHANIIINSGKAKSIDIYNLSLQMKESAKKALNIELEHEIILLGDKNLWTRN